MKFDFERVAIVTGANRGIGYEICRQLAQRNILVILTARDIQGGQAAAEKFIEDGLPVRFWQLDVTDESTAAGMITFVEGEIGRLDILVNNAGIYIDRGISPLEVELEMVRQTMETNFLGPLRLAQAAVPLMKRNGYGRIVNLSSQMGSLTNMGRRGLAYRTSKAALNALTRVLASELKSSNILVNSVDPGWVRSDMGGSNAPRSLYEGADTAVWLATLPEDGPTGGFFRDRKSRDW